MTAIQRERAKLWKAIVNWKGETHFLFTRAQTMKGAKTQVIKQLSDILGLKPQTVSVKILDGVSLILRECKDE